MILRCLTGLMIFICLGACSLPASTRGNDRLTVLDYHVIPPKHFNGIKLTELSGLAWDQDEQLLYAVSDKGHLYHFRLQLQGNLIKAVTPVFATTLLNNKGKALPHYRRDAEGLTVLHANNRRKGDSELLIAMEGQPRVLRFSTEGRMIGQRPLPVALQGQEKLRHRNIGLESVAWHPQYGLLTAPERSLKGQPENLHTVYSRKKQWSFMAYNAPKSSITALEMVPGTQQLLVLERAWSGFPNPMVNSLRLIHLDQCPGGKKVCPVDELRAFSSALSIDNFEGLTHIKNNLYLMVSDDGDRDILRTLLTLFRIER